MKRYVTETLRFNIFGGLAGKCLLAPLWGSCWREGGSMLIPDQLILTFRFLTFVPLFVTMD